MTFLHDPFNAPIAPAASKPPVESTFIHSAVKQAEAATLRAEIEAWVAAGGHIEVLPWGAGRKARLGKTRSQMTRAERARASKQRQQQQVALDDEDE